MTVGDAVPVTVKVRNANYYLETSDFRVGQITDGMLYGVGVGTVTVDVIGYRENSDGTFTDISDTVSVTVVAPPRSNRPALSLLESGELVTCGLSADSSVFCWGNTSAFRPYAPRCEDYVEHQLQRVCNSVPTRVTNVPQFKYINSGMFSTCGITTADEAFCWGIGALTYNGSGSPGIVPGGVQFVTLEVEAGWDLSYGGEVEHVCGIDTTKQLWCWTRGGVVTKPSIMQGANYVAVTLGGISSGTSDTFRGCALDTAGVAYCWGTAALGDGNPEGTNNTGPVAVGGTLRFSAMASSADLTCALDFIGALYCWGGRTTLAPTAIPAAVSFTAISGASTRFCALGTDQSAYCWDQQSLQPTRVESTLKFRAVTAGGQVNCALTTEAVEVCWGSRSYGGVGDGLVGGPVASTPIPVAGQRVWP